MKNHVTTFETFLNESGFHAALAKAKEEGLEEFEFAGKKYKVQKDALEESTVNEGYVPYPPELEKELAKDLDPLFKAYDIEVKRVGPSSLGGDLPVVDAIGYSLLNGNWTTGTFFNKKDAEAALDLFAKTEVKAISSKRDLVVKNASMGITLFGDELEALAREAKVKIDFDAIEAKVKEWQLTQNK